MHLEHLVPIRKMAVIIFQFVFFLLNNWINKFLLNPGITNRLLSKGGLLSERKHGSVKQAFGDVKNTFQPTNNGGQNFQKQTPMKVFNKQNENTKVMTPSVKQNTNLREKSLGKCSYKTIKDERYYWYKNAAWTDEQMDIFIKKANQEPVYEEVVLLPVTKEIPYTFDLMDISLPTERNFFDLFC